MLLKNKTIPVTGAYGFCGSHLAEMFDGIITEYADKIRTVQQKVASPLYCFEQEKR
jgi:nucleoside-diphosphate-sugar epimerase